MLDDLPNAYHGAQRRRIVVMILPLESLEAGHGDLTGAIQAMIHHFLITGLEYMQRLNRMRQQHRVRQGEQWHRLAEIDSDDFTHRCNHRPRRRNEVEVLGCGSITGQGY